MNLWFFCLFPLLSFLSPFAPGSFFRYFHFRPRRAVSSFPFIAHPRILLFPFPSIWFFLNNSSQKRKESSSPPPPPPPPPVLFVLSSLLITSQPPPPNVYSTPSSLSQELMHAFLSSPLSGSIPCGLLNQLISRPPQS